MKRKIEVVANVAVILLAVVIGSIFLKDRFFTPAPESNEVKAGDKLASLVKEVVQEECPVEVGSLFVANRRAGGRVDDTYRGAYCVDRDASNGKTTITVV